MTRPLVPALAIGGAGLVIASLWVGGVPLIGAGCLITLAGMAVGILHHRRGTLPEKLAEFGSEFDRNLPSGGTGRDPTPRSATLGVAYAAVTALCWIALFLLGGDVRGSSLQYGLVCVGTVLGLGGWVERLRHVWGAWWKALLWLAALPASWTLVVIHEWVAGLAFGAILMYGVWSWPGLPGWERRPRRRPRSSRPGRRARRRAQAGGRRLP